MAVLQSGAGSTTQTVDPANNAARIVIYDASGNQVKADTDGNLKVQIRPPAFGALGAYSKGLTTGVIATTGTANAVIWSMRWTDGTRLCLVERVRVAACVTSAVTAGLAYNLQLFASRSYTTSPTTSIGTTATFSGNNAKRRTSQGTSLFTAANAGMWILGTAAAGLTGQAFTNDTDPLATLVGGIAASAPAGSQIFGPNPASIWDDNVDGHPIILAANEGLTIQAPLAGPATGGHQITVAIDWMEVAAY